MHITDLIRDEVESPLARPMDLTHLVLLIGIVMAAVILWSRVLAHLAHTVHLT